MDSNMGLKHGLKHGTQAKWDSNMGLKHGTQAWTKTWDSNMHPNMGLKLNGTQT